MCDFMVSTEDMREPDSLLVISAKNGDQGAFVILLQQCLPGVSRKIRRITRNSADAEDVLQDAALRAYLKLSTFRAGCSFSSWFGRIAINSALMHLRKRHRRQEAPIDGPREDLRSFRIELHDQAATPEETYLKQEGLARLRQAMLRMHNRDRAIIEMQWRGSSLQEIAHMTGLSIGAIKSRLFRSKMLLRKQI